jgi:cold shock CspA family protein
VPESCVYNVGRGRIVRRCLLLLDGSCAVRVEPHRDPDRGFGFISRDNGDDVFVRVSVLKVGARAALPKARASSSISPTGAKVTKAPNVRVL